KEKPKFNITDITKRSFDALNLLGVNSSSVFLSNCTIWVEGISDRLYIRKYLEIYQKENPNQDRFNEDIHYSFVEYAGNNITHWSFLDIADESINYESISRNIFLITDKDSGKEKRHKKLEKHLGKNYYCLKCLEIENLLKPEVLKNTIQKYAKNQDENIKFKSFDTKQNSNNNKPEFIYSLEDIGEFIYSSVIVDESQINIIAPKPSGDKKTRKISGKYKFAKNAIDSISCWEDMSKEAQDLAEKIYQFIGENNKS
ncbi:MAG: ATP/GTP-binding protein, partial [Chlorobi bacterium]|nr:ATP/GTP-binding protein [Chlorobiota bacterium]